MGKEQKKQDKSQERSEKIKEQIESRMKKQQERKLIEELGKRISLAREGRMAFEKKNFALALQNYRRFLSLTEQQFKVNIQQLRPSMIEERSRVKESILISAVGLDMAIMLDKLEGASAARERHQMFQLFVNFSSGQPFQHFAADNLRRYLSYSTNIRHKGEFQTALKTVSGSKFCIVATLVYGSIDAPEVVKLRAFRDQVLVRHWHGRILAELYYRWGHFFVPLWRNSQLIRYLTGRAVRRLSRFLSHS